MPDTNDRDLNSLITAGAGMAGNLTSVITGLAIAGPPGAILGAITAPLLTEGLHRVGNYIANKPLAQNEEERIGATYIMAHKLLEQRLGAGETIREDGFYCDQSGDRSYSETILEGTLLKAREEYEHKKLIHFSNLLASINFREDISFEQVNTMLRIIESLGYRQIAILSYFNEVEDIPLNNWAPAFTHMRELGKHQDFYSDLMNLYNNQLLMQSRTTGFSMSPQGLKLSTFGKMFSDLIGIEMVNELEKESIGSTIEEIQRIADSYQSH